MPVSTLLSNPDKPDPRQVLCASCGPNSGQEVCLWSGKLGSLLRADRAPGWSAFILSATRGPGRANTQPDPPWFLPRTQRFLNLKLQRRDNGRVSRAAVLLSLNQLLDQWPTTVVKARVRTRRFKDYEALLKLYIRPALGGRLIGTLSQIDIQNMHAQMF
jgi:hypothetical protein